MISMVIKLGSFVDVLQSVVDTIISLFNLLKSFIVSIINTIPVFIDLMAHEIVYSNTVMMYCSVLTPFVLIFNIGLVIGIIRSLL